MNKDKIRFNDHFFAWAFFYAIAVFLSIQSIRFFNLSGSLSGIFLAGLIITLFSWIMYSFLYKNKFRLSKWFFIWLFTHSFNFWLIDLVLRKLTLTYEGFLYFLILGIVYHPITWIIKHKIYYKIRMNMQKTIIIILILIVALIFASSQPFSEIQTSGLIGNNSFGFSLNSLRNLFSLNLPLSNSCPQIDVPILLNKELGYYITNKNNINPKDTIYFDLESAQNDFLNRVGQEREDTQKGWKISVYNIAESFGIKTDYVFCHKGNSEGENPDYFYCDSGGMGGGIPYLSKTSVNSDGTIGKTIRKSFINVYDSDNKFIKTICGKSPEDIAEEEFKQTMREMDDFFSLK